LINLTTENISSIPKNNYDDALNVAMIHTKEMQHLNSLFQSKDIIPTSNLLTNSKRLVIVDNEQTLELAAIELQQSCLIGVDLEYHTELNSSNIGFVCLLQLSTITTDYIIDAILLRDKIHQYLAKIFESEDIIKAFHGCDNDLIWLKVDFDIDVMNLFDTARAHMYAKGNKHEHLSLATITKIYLNIQLPKLYQTADWRVRPLPKGMIDYARNDSYVLIYLWWHLQEEIKKSNELMKKMAIKMNRLCFKALEKCSMKKIKLQTVGPNNNTLVVRAPENI